MSFYTRLSIAVGFSLGALIASATASANDTATGGSGSNLTPLEVSEIRMASEDIVIRAEGQHWEVTAEYVFENHSDRAIELQIGFPEYACEGGDPSDMCDPKPLRFKSMVTTVEGVPVAHRKGTFRKDHEWMPRLGQVWLYDVRFPPKQLTRIGHRYKVSAGQVSDGTIFGHYVTRTGAPWAGTIGQARFRVRVPLESAYAGLTTDECDLEVTKRVIEIEGQKVGELMFEARAWEPRGDLHFEYHVLQRAPIMETFERSASIDGPPLPTERCPSIVALMTRGEERGKASAITPADALEFAANGIGDARICRNYVFAAHGRRFRDEALNGYFYGPRGFVDEGWPHAPYAPNASFELAMLGAHDWATLRLIDEIERANATDWHR